MSTTKREGSGWSVAGVVSGLLVLFSTGWCGAMLGGLYVRLFVPRTGMGWDQLADALGGLMLGGGLGLLLGGVLVAVLDSRRRFIAAAVLHLVAVVAIAAMWAMREPRRESEPVVVEKPFAPWFKLAIRVGHTEEILRAVEPGAEPVPFTEAKLFTAVPELEHIGWGPDFRSCRAEPSRDDLRALVPLVTALAAEAAAGSCLTPRKDDLGVPFNLTLDGESGSGTVQADCLAQRPALVNLAAALEELAGRICPSAG